MHTFRMQSELGARASHYANFGLPRLIILLAAPWKLLIVWMDRRQQRLALTRLNDRMLRDIGISRFNVVEECRKPFWRA